MAMNDKSIREAMALLKLNASRDIILEKFDNETFELAKARIKGKEKHPKADKLFMLLDDLRWATPYEVAEYRAKRLSCNKIADLGCGVGFQSFSFAKHCKSVVAVDIDRRKIEFAKLNAEALGIKNIEFIEGDILSKKVADKLKDADAFFCDPERLPSETARTIKTMRPDIEKLLKLYPKICIEFPPMIKNIPFECEKEYLSLNGELNRLNLYFSELRKCRASAVVLPQGAVIRASVVRNIIAEEQKAPKIMDFFYEVDPAVEKAELTAELLLTMKNAYVYEQDNDIYLTSGKLLKNDFVKAYKVLEVVEDDFDKILEALQRQKAGKVVLRMTVSPKDYWTERNKYERSLLGDKEVHLFVFDRAVIAEKL